jgi:hypothetical protein
LRVGQNDVMIRLKLAEWIVALDVNPDRLAAQLAERYTAFAVAGELAPDLSVRITQEGGEGAGSLLRTAVAANGEEYLLDAPTLYGMIGPFRGQAELRMRSEAPTRESEYFLRIALALFAWSHGGLLIHSAGILVGEAVFLFTGQSGSGKSTVVSLSQKFGRPLALSDDLVLLRPMDQHWRAYGTPFWNLRTEQREGQTASGRVQAIYKLVQDREVFAEPISSAAAAAELLANCPVVNSQPALLPELLLRCREVAKAVKVQRLHFRKDEAFWKIISC